MQALLLSTNEAAALKILGNLPITARAWTLHGFLAPFIAELRSQVRALISLTLNDNDMHSGKGESAALSASHLKQHEAIAWTNTSCQKHLHTAKILLSSKHFYSVNIRLWVFIY